MDIKQKVIAITGAGRGLGRAIALSLAVGTTGVTTLDSGGTLVEMSDLAKAVRAAINPAASTPSTVGASRAT